MSSSIFRKSRSGLWAGPVLAGILLIPFLQAASEDSFTWTGSDGKPLSFSSRQDLEQFLLTAQIVDMEKIPVGINKPRKMRLAKDGREIHAVFRDVDIERQKFQDRKGPRLNFRDFCIYECAAYELSKLVSIPNIPPVVRRQLLPEDFLERKDYGKLERKSGTLQAWVEGSFTEKDRQDKKLQPPDRLAWANQFHIMKVFDSLIFNDDRNTGNILIGPDWTIWFIDSTRAFRTFNELSEPDKIRRCDRKVFEALKNLTDDQLDASLNDLLEPDELRTLKARRLELVKLIQGMIDQLSEESVLFEYY